VTQILALLGRFKSCWQSVCSPCFYCHVLCCLGDGSGAGQQHESQPGVPDREEVDAGDRDRGRQGHQLRDQQPHPRQILQRESSQLVQSVFQANLGLR